MGSDRVTLAGATPWTKLSQGMAIRAAIEARLLGKRLLTLNANITILPTAGDARTRSRPMPPTTGQSLRLEDAARAMESVSSDLKSARDQMP